MLYDRDIREPLFDFLEEVYGKVRILEEKNIAASRADVFMITEQGFYGIEIKSDADTYARLAGQIRDYDLFYDYNYIAVGSRHAMHVQEHVPDYWGIITIDEVMGRPDFYILRRPERNPGRELKRKLSLLWRPELAKLQEQNGMPAYKHFSKAAVIERIAERIPAELLEPQMAELLFQRDYTTILEEINAFRAEQNQKPRRARRRRIRKEPELLVKRVVRHRRKKTP